jgi:hypothetical protein
MLHATLSQEPQPYTRQAENTTHYGKYRHNLRFLPAAQFKVMMDGRHTENALAPGMFEIRDLNDN